MTPFMAVRVQISLFSKKFDGSNLGDQIMDFEIGTDQIRVQADWVKDGWISLDFTPDENDKTVDVEITLAKRFEAGELSDYIEKYDALSPDFDPSVNKITLRDVNYEGLFRLRRREAIWRNPVPVRGQTRIFYRLPAQQCAIRHFGINLIC